MPQTIAHYRWDDMPEEQITPSIGRRFISADRVTIARFRLTRGGVVPAHKHENEQITTVWSGALKFVFPSGGGQETIVRAGEVIQLPSNVEHEVHVLEDAIVMDVFCPVRQDWIDKTDDYFKRAVAR